MGTHLLGWHIHQYLKMTHTLRINDGCVLEAFSFYYSRLSLNGHLCKTNTSVKRTPRVGPCLSLLPLFDSL